MAHTWREVASRQPGDKEWSSRRDTHDAGPVPAVVRRHVDGQRPDIGALYEPAETEGVDPYVDDSTVGRLALTVGFAGYRSVPIAAVRAMHP